MDILSLYGQLEFNRSAVVKENCCCHPFLLFSTSGDFSINEKLQLKNLITQKKEEIGNKFYVCPGYTLS